MRQTAQQYRHELKFRLSRGSREILRQRFKAAMKPDAHAENGIYRVTSLYFDDIYKSAYRDKVSGVLDRRKFRIRTYDLDPSFIRLEEKCKNGDLGYKKSAVLSLEEYRLILAGETGFLSQERFSGTAAEDLYWSWSAAGLSPAVAVDYFREPYTCDAGNVRVTFDMRLCAGTGYDMFAPEERFVPVFTADETVLEVKYDDFLPMYIQELLSGVPLQRESVSKYVECLDARARLLMA